MFILIKKVDDYDKTENVILEMAKELDRQENGNYLLDPLHDDLNNGRVAIPAHFVDNVYEVEDIPENIEPSKYCYSVEKGFYKNPNYKRFYSEEERISNLEKMMNELLLGEE